MTFEVAKPLTSEDRRNGMQNEKFARRVELPYIVLSTIQINCVAQVPLTSSRHVHGPLSSLHLERPADLRDKPPFPQCMSQY
jgi:hypothetical protein